MITAASRLLKGQAAGPFLQLRWYFKANLCEEYREKYMLTILWLSICVGGLENSHDKRDGNLSPRNPQQAQHELVAPSVDCVFT